MSGTGPARVRNPPLPHSDEVPGIRARSLMALPRPCLMSVCVQRPDRERWSSLDSVWAPRVVAVTQTPPRPSGASRLGMARPGAVNRRQFRPFQWARITRPAGGVAGEFPSTQTLWRATATTSSSCVPASTELVRAEEPYVRRADHGEAGRVRARLPPSPGD
jgi:hypothetical protein